MSESDILSGSPSIQFWETKAANNEKIIEENKHA